MWQIKAHTTAFSQRLGLLSIYIVTWQHVRDNEVPWDGSEQSRPIQAIPGQCCPWQIMEQPKRADRQLGAQDEYSDLQGELRNQVVERLIFHVQPFIVFEFLPCPLLLSILNPILLLRASEHLIINKFQVSYSMFPGKTPHSEKVGLDLAHPGKLKLKHLGNAVFLCLCILSKWGQKQRVEM